MKLGSLYPAFERNVRDALSTMTTATADVTTVLSQDAYELIGLSNPKTDPKKIYIIINEPEVLAPEASQSRSPGNYDVMCTLTIVYKVSALYSVREVLDLLPKFFVPMGTFPMWDTSASGNFSDWVKDTPGVVLDISSRASYRVGEGRKQIPLAVRVRFHR